MATRTLFIGDVQGCAKTLFDLLQQANWQAPEKLVFLGDVVNRGPDSLAVAQFLLRAQEHVELVLGNHDLHFLAVAAGVRAKGKNDTLDALLAAPICDEFCDWLRHRPLALKAAPYLCVHAGIWPTWSQQQALTFSAEIEQQLQSSDWRQFLASVFANGSGLWHEALPIIERAQCLINIFTRMRFLRHQPQANEASTNTHGDYALDFHHKQKNSTDANLVPWFTLRPASHTDPIVFGHWATLGAKVFEQTDFVVLNPSLPAHSTLASTALRVNSQVPWQLYHHTLCLDSGCVWGQALSALDYVCSDLNSQATERQLALTV